jgi:hypothetical protein
VIYTTGLELEAAYGLTCQKYMAIITETTQWIAHELAAS